jgi:hypothetical protein
MFLNVSAFTIIARYEFVSEIRNNIIFALKENLKFVSNVFEAESAMSIFF